MKKVPVYEAATAWNRGIPCHFFSNTNKKLYILYTNLFNYCIIKGIKVNKSWRWIKKVSAFDTDFLVWIMEKDGLGISSDRYDNIHAWICV